MRNLLSFGSVIILFGGSLVACSGDPAASESTEAAGDSAVASASTGDVAGADNAGADGLGMMAGAGDGMAGAANPAAGAGAANEGTAGTAAAGAPGSTEAGAAGAAEAGQPSAGASSESAGAGAGAAGEAGAAAGGAGDPAEAGASADPDPSEEVSEVEELVPNATCVIAPTATLSDAIETVGLVTFTTDLPSVDGGYVEFGLDEAYGMRAPIEVDAEGHRTVLVGMRQASDYHFRVVAQAGDQVCASDDGLLTTGTAPAGVPSVTVNVSQAAKVAPGFIITTTGSYILIADNEGNVVWWHDAGINGMSRARMSWDAKFLYGRDGNPGGNAGGRVVRVSIDGQDAEPLTIDTGHHDMTTMPDNSVLFLIGGGGEGCSQIERLSSTDELSLVYDLRDAFGDDFRTGNDPCHCNSIHYNPEDESISVSCLTQNAYVKITSAGQLLWVLGGNNGQSHFTGDIEWNRQHGHHMVTKDRILFFNNNGLGAPGAGGPGGGMMGGGGSSLAVEMQLDLEAMTSTLGWTYDGGESSSTLGDVQRLPNGNTLITYSNAGLSHEVDAAGELVQIYTFPGGVGYAEHRPTLYGAPPHP